MLPPAMLDGILDQRLQQEARDTTQRGRRLQGDLRPQAIAETRLLNAKVGGEPTDFRFDRHDRVVDFFFVQHLTEHLRVLDLLQHDHDPGEAAVEHHKRLRALLDALCCFDQPSMEQAVQAYIDAQGIKFKLLAQPIRIAITGGTASPGLFETMAVMGKKRVLARIDRALSL